jgi:macrodomain Ter protein organizer (MatP/YcbG family)
MYDPTLIFKWLDDLALLGEKLSPAINAWIQTQIPLVKQRVINKKMRRCVRHCRKMKFGADQVAKQVDLDFMDLSDTQRGDIISLIDFQLFGK